MQFRYQVVSSIVVPISGIAQHYSRRLINRLMNRLSCFTFSHFHIFSRFTLLLHFCFWTFNNWRRKKDVCLTLKTCAIVNEHCSTMYKGLQKITA